MLRHQYYVMLKETGSYRILPTLGWLNLWHHTIWVAMEHGKASLWW